MNALPVSLLNAGRLSSDTECWVALGMSPKRWGVSIMWLERWVWMVEEVARQRDAVRVGMTSTLRCADAQAPPRVSPIMLSSAARDVAKEMGCDGLLAMRVWLNPDGGDICTMAQCSTIRHDFDATTLEDQTKKLRHCSCTLRLFSRAVSREALFVVGHETTIWLSDGRADRNGHREQMQYLSCLL